MSDAVHHGSKDISIPNGLTGVGHGKYGTKTNNMHVLHPFYNHHKCVEDIDG